MLNTQSVSLSTVTHTHTHTPTHTHPHLLTPIIACHSFSHKLSCRVYLLLWQTARLVESEPVPEQCTDCCFQYRDSGTNRYPVEWRQVKRHNLQSKFKGLLPQSLTFCIPYFIHHGCFFFLPQSRIVFLSFFSCVNCASYYYKG